MMKLDILHFYRYMPITTCDFNGLEIVVWPTLLQGRELAEGV